MKYTMTSDQLARLMDASKPTPYMIIGSCMPVSPQENANRAWQSLGEEMGFKWDTVEPGNSNLEFTAEPKELV